ncbi:DASH complex subunit Dad2-domain-containing protein [Dipodascopsis uninucleata]
MSYPQRRTTFVPTSSMSMSGSAIQYNTALAAKIAEKKQELDSLMQLRDLSANFTSQMEQLQVKLSTLVDGTEAVALVLSNWDSILRAITMAANHLPRPTDEQAKYDEGEGNIDENIEKENKRTNKQKLPETLVRIRTSKDTHLDS